MPVKHNSRSNSEKKWEILKKYDDFNAQLGKKKIRITIEDYPGDK